MKKGDYSKGGFTVIEVTLVLAVAGLIFAMAFIALPALQRSQRDNDRRDDMTKFITEVKRYQTSNRGNLPSGLESVNFVDEKNFDNQCSSSQSGTWLGFYCGYLGNRFIDPDGKYYGLRVYACGETQGDKQCSDSGATSAINNLKNSTSGGDDRYNMLVITRAKCDGDSVLSSSSPRSLAVLYRLEGAGVYCYGT